MPQQLKKEKFVVVIELLFLFLITALAYSGLSGDWIVYQMAASPSLPRLIETYHGQTTLIEHKKQVRNQNDTITQRFSFRIETVDGHLHLLVQKDDQRRIKAKKESQVKSLTADVIKKVLIWMDFSVDKITNMTKAQLVEFICLVFQIPTEETLNIDEKDATDIIQYLIEVIEEGDIAVDLQHYIEHNHANMTIISDIVALCEENIDLRPYCLALWLQLMDNFGINRNNDVNYKKGFDLLKKSKELVGLRKNLKNDVTNVLNVYNNDNDNNINPTVFWYSFDLSLYRFFNYSIKESILLTYINEPETDEEQINESIRCIIYKYFGSAFYGSKQNFKGNNYGELKRECCLCIIDACLLSYDMLDFEAKSEECKNEEYLQVPLKLRLQNRGHLLLIKQSFYQIIAINVYTKILNAVKNVFICYDGKKIEQIERKVKTDASLFDKFSKHIGSISKIQKKEEESAYKQMVWNDVIHRVTSRIVISLKKRYKTHNNHVGQFRVGVKAKQSKQ